MGTIAITSLSKNIKNRRRHGKPEGNGVRVLRPRYGHGRDGLVLKALVDITRIPGLNMIRVDGHRKAGSDHFSG